LVLIALASVITARAGESAFADIQRIFDASVVRVAIMARDVPPLIMTEDGGPAGSEADLALDLAAKLGVEVEFLRTADTYDAVVDQVAAKEADLGISFLSSSVERALRVYFSRPYIQQSGRVFYSRTAFARLKRDYDIDALSEIGGTGAVDALELGVVKGSTYQTILERDFSRFRVKPYPGLPELMEAVRNNAIFGGVHGSLQIKFYMHEHPSTAIHVALDPALRRPSDISIAVRPDAPNLLRWVDVYLANNVGMEDADEVIDRYVKEASKDED
jgi:ABC-type amino acid transport substrate-binding protein